MLIEVPSSYVENVLFFHKIHELCKNEKSTILFINTSYSDINYEKLLFLNSVLYYLLLDIKIIIDREVPKYHENILFMSKLSKKAKVSLEDINIHDIINNLNNRVILRLNYKKYYFSKKFEGYNTYENLSIICRSIESIKQIVTNERNVKVLFDIHFLLKKNINSDIFQNNYSLLKSEIMNILNEIKITPMDNISVNINLNKDINKEISFR